MREEMNVEDILAYARQALPELMMSYCVVNGAFMPLNEIENMKYEEFALRSHINMPLKLYKYFPNRIEKVGEQEINYSLTALENNTVFMQSPNNFDDTFDSEINITFMEYERYRLIEYCRRSGLSIEEELTTEEIENAFIQIIERLLIDNNLRNLFSESSESEIERLSNEIFYQKLLLELKKESNLASVVKKIIYSEYKEYMQELKNIFRVSCFATTPLSQIMWGKYANCHSGFCVEYTILPDDKKYKNIYYNLFPLIYCKSRSNIAEKLVLAKDKVMNEEILWEVYRCGTLRKSIDWTFQNEWRLLLPMNSKDIADYNVRFFPITKVYLGNKMTKEQRKQIIEICKRKNIPYVGVIKDPDIFDMKQCEMKCEECPNYIEQSNV